MSPGRAQARGARARVALLSTWHPEPVDNGRKQRTRQMIAALAEEFEVVLISLLPPQEIAAGAQAPVPGVWRQWALPLPEFSARSFSALIAGLHPQPRSVVATWRRDTAERVVRLCREVHVQLAIGTDLRTLRYLLALDPGVVALLDEPDVSWFTLQASASMRGLGWFRALGRRRKYARLLRVGARRLAAAIVASPGEAHAYRQLAGPTRVEVIENAVGALPEPAWRAPGGAQLLYAGSLTYGPNAEAVAHFSRAILPQIEQEVPDVRLLVTGALPMAIPPACRHPCVVPTGWLDANALEAAYRDSRACVVPLLSGTGTRIKLLEAMALGIPVVSTTKGAEGLGVVPGQDYLRADTPADFAAATTRLLCDAAFARAIGARARARIRQDYSWAVRGQQLRDLVVECLAGRKEGAWTARRA